jgi:glycosyltransferase involved in cell wall biosynthesis
MLAITIPAHNQPILLRRCLDSLSKQTFRDFDIYIIDDASEKNYTSVISDFSHLNIHYIRNDSNLGAIKNIEASIKYPADSTYIMSLHEDDYLSGDYLERTIHILETERDIAFVGSQGIWFSEHSAIRTPNIIQNSDFTKYNVSDFIIYILSNNRLIFGSIVYRRKLLNNIVFRLKEFDVLCDRVFLIDLLMDSNSSCALLSQPGIFVNDHLTNDKRWISLKENHLFSLYNYYRTFLQTYDQRKMWLKSSTNSVLMAFPISDDVSIISYLFRAYKNGFFNPIYIDKTGLYAIVKEILGEKIAYKLKRYSIS